MRIAPFLRSNGLLIWKGEKYGSLQDTNRCQFWVESLSIAVSKRVVLEGVTGRRIGGAQTAALNIIGSGQQIVAVGVGDW